MMRDPSTGSGQSASGLQYFLIDHLGSTVAITDSNGTLTSQQRYLPFGGTLTNVTAPNSPGTDFGYTGQRQLDAGMGGLMDYKARFYSPYLNRFTQPDTLIPGMFNPQNVNRYSYVRNNPIKYTDPSGHDIACDDEMSKSECARERRIGRADTVGEWKSLIKDEFGITMSEKSDDHNTNPKAWNMQNLMIIYNALNTINGALNGKLKSLADGATFKWGEYSNSDCSGGTYCGRTYGTTIEFFNVGQAGIRLQNIFHEFAHVLDNSPNTFNAFSHAEGINNPEFLDDNGRLDYSALINKSHDMYQDNLSAYTDDMVKAQNEHWGDMFANYVAGNIDLTSPEGQAMNEFVQGALRPYIGTP